MSLVITDAGIAASINAQTLGVEYKITHIAIGLEGYLPTVDQTELRQEFTRKPLSRGAIIAPGQLHFEAVFDDNSAFEGKEIGYFLEDGTLFAVDSREGEILSLKRSNTIITEAFELNLDGSEISNITVEIMGMPYATETVAGIAKIATDAEVAAGVDDTKIVTAKKLKKPLTEYLRKDAKTTLTDNDSIGNANIVFNHRNGVPSSDGSAGRLNVGTDINDAVAWFGLASNVKAGIAVALTKIFNATITKFDVLVNLHEKGQRVFSPNNRNISDSTSGTSSTIYASQKAVKSINDKFTKLINKSFYANTTAVTLTASVGSVKHKSISSTIWRYLESDDGFSIGGEIKLNFNTINLPSDDEFSCTVYIPNDVKSQFKVSRLFNSCGGVASVSPFYSGTTNRDFTPVAARVVTGPTQDSFLINCGELLAESRNGTASATANMITITFNLTGVGKIKS